MDDHQLETLMLSGSQEYRMVITVLNITIDQ